MKNRHTLRRTLSIVYGVLICLLAPRRSWAEPSPEAAAAFDTYVVRLEARLAAQHRAHTGFIAGMDPSTVSSLRSGGVVIQEMTPPGGEELPGAILHHWRGSAFAPGATVAGFEALLRNFSAYPRIFSPQVLAAGDTPEDENHLRAWMRVRQKHVLTVVMDSTYDVAFGRLDGTAAFSSSRSTRIYEIGGHLGVHGAGGEHPLTPAEEHGFLWRLNTYWTYEQRDGGLYLQVESVSLSRSIPTGLGWAVRPFVESVPRESLEFTLRAARSALH